MAGTKELKLTYNQPAPDSVEGWLAHSIPMGNGYMGLNIFGGVEKERVQITENSLQDSNNTIGGLNNFAEVYIDFPHKAAENYKRELSLESGVTCIRYSCGGVTYEREIFASYPDRATVIRLTASEPGQLAFTLRPVIPYICSYRQEPGDHRGKYGIVNAAGDTITLSGIMEYYNVQFEGQLKVIPIGGTMEATNDASGGNGTITVTGADSAVILIAVGTNYRMDSKVISSADRLEKLKGNPHPHEMVSGIISAVSAKSYDELMAAHLKDYTGLYGRVSLDLGGQQPDVPTDELVRKYRDGECDAYLEELVFQYGRYLLICSSRAGALPPNLQGVWNVYQDPPFRSGYWHNVNLQMNYWPAFPGNLPELFESYIEYYNAYAETANENATRAIERLNPSALRADKAENGWAMGNSCWPYVISGTSNHSGYGTGAWVAMLFWDYFDYTRDMDALRDIVYPVVSGSSKFLSKIVKPVKEGSNELLLTDPSYSPENKHEGVHYKTVGSTFDQQMIQENHWLTYKGAKLLGISEDISITAIDQLNKLSPFIIGKSGQLKEYREEEYYGDIGERNHRHISHLLGAYPGQLINPQTTAWLDAVKVSLTERGRGERGWAEAQRIATWARTLEGEQAYSYYNALIKTHMMYNLFNNHPMTKSHEKITFQIDGNFGATAGVCEMLLMSWGSMGNIIAPLPALPEKWSGGSYRGLLARGNFEVSASWSNSHADRIEILSKSGGKCALAYDNIENAAVRTDSGEDVALTVEFSNNVNPGCMAGGMNIVSFETTAGQRYIITDIPARTPVAPPSGLLADILPDGTVRLSWTPSEGAASYNIYNNAYNAPAYWKLATDVKECSYIHKRGSHADGGAVPELNIFRVTAVGHNGRESKGITVIISF